MWGPNSCQGADGGAFCHRGGRSLAGGPTPNPTSHLVPPSGQAALGLPAVGHVGNGLRGGAAMQDTPAPSGSGAGRGAKCNTGPQGRTWTTHLDHASEWRSVLGSCLQKMILRGGRWARAHLRPRPARTCVLRPEPSLTCLALRCFRGHTPTTHTAAWLGLERM